MSKTSSLLVAIAAFFVLISGLWIQTSRLNHANEKANSFELALKNEQKDKADLEAKNRKASESDSRLTMELVNAKNEIAQLRHDVANGAKRMQLNAKCSATSKSSTGGVDDATAARLTDSAQRDYFILRERAEQSRLMILGLQEYIRDVCL